MKVTVSYDKFTSYHAPGSRWVTLETRKYGAAHFPCGNHPLEREGRRGAIKYWNQLRKKEEE